MATDIASLAIKIESLQVQQAEGRLQDLTAAGGKAERASDGLATTFKKMLGPLAAAATAMKVLSSAISVQREYDQLSSALTTVTGSMEKASEVFAVLQQYANDTPFSINQLNEAFVKLVNYGLTPSEAALTSYGNTAVSMGKTITEMVDAVAAATTGNFESLKSFGILTKNQGDTVAFTFQGMTTTVKNSSEAIEGYLLKLGDVQFAGAMANSLGKLDDTILGLGEQWDTLLLNIMQGGLGEGIQEGVQIAVDALTELNDMFRSGEMEQYLGALADQFRNFGRDAGEAITILTEAAGQDFGYMSDLGRNAVEFLIEAFKWLPVNVRAFIQAATVEISAAFDAWTVLGRFAKDAMAAVFSNDTVGAAAQRAVGSIQAINSARETSLQTIMNERQASMSAADAKIAKAKEVREAYEKERNALKGDRLAGYKINGDGSADGPDKAADKAAKAAARAAAAAEKSRQREFESLVDSLRTEEEVIAQSYAKRKAIIEGSTKAGSAMQADLMARLEADRAEQTRKLERERSADVDRLKESLLTQEEAVRASYDKRMEVIAKSIGMEAGMRADLEGKVAAERDKALANIEKGKQSERDSLYTSLLTQEEDLLRSYERKRELILGSEAVTELERQDLLRRLSKQFAEEQQAMEMERINSQLQAGQALFDGLAGLAKGYAGEQSKAYRVLFAVSKAFSVAQAAMSISTGLAKAQELGFPANLAEMARVAATGASIVSQISGSQFSGAHDQGGQIPAGKVGIVGEYGPELVRGPASVRGRELSSRTYPNGGGQAPAAPPQVNVRNINVLDPSLVGDYLGTDAGEKLIMNVVQRNQSALGF